MKISRKVFEEIMTQWDRHFNINGWFQANHQPQIGGDLFDPLRIYYYSPLFLGFAGNTQPNKERDCWLWFEKGLMASGGNIIDLVAKRGGGTFSIVNDVGMDAMCKQPIDLTHTNRDRHNNKYIAKDGGTSGLYWDFDPKAIFNVYFPIQLNPPSGPPPGSPNVPPAGPPPSKLWTPAFAPIFVPVKITITRDEVLEKSPSINCECGADKVRSPQHSHWCPKYKS